MILDDFNGNLYKVSIIGEKSGLQKFKINVRSWQNAKSILNKCFVLLCMIKTKPRNKSYSN